MFNDTLFKGHSFNSWKPTIVQELTFSYLRAYIVQNWTVKHIRSVSMGFQKNKYVLHDFCLFLDDSSSGSLLLFSNI